MEDCRLPLSHNELTWGHWSAGKFTECAKDHPPPICDCCGGGPMLDRGGFYDCFCCGHNREKGGAR